MEPVMRFLLKASLLLTSIMVSAGSPQSRRSFRSNTVDWALRDLGVGNKVEEVDINPAAEMLRL